MLSRVANSYQVQSEAVGADEVVHTVRLEEEVAFSNWINNNLHQDADLKKLLPLLGEGKELYTKIEDGLILCKLVNLAVPETIDERAINKRNLNTYSKLENLTLALMSAQSIGCNIMNIDCDDLSKGKPHLVLGLLWQIIRIGLLSQIDLQHVPGLFNLLKAGETHDDLRKLSPEQILIRWVNYHLENAGVERRMTNFSTDVVDSTIYTHLLKEIADPEDHVTLAPLVTSGGILDRASAMLQQAEKLACREFVTAYDVVSGNYKLNLAFVANLFNHRSGFKIMSRDEMAYYFDQSYEETREDREERTYRNWMNSMGVDPFVNWLYSDMKNGVVIFQLYDIIRPGIVNWKRVVKQFRKLHEMMQQIQNCNYAIELGKQLGFSLVGIQGKDIYDGNQTLCLALVWQLMRAYTLTILADREIVAWVNEKLRSSGKTSSINSFTDSSISDARVVLDLIDSIKPGAIDYDLVTEACIENAKYAITNGDDRLRVSDG